MSTGFRIIFESYDLETPNNTLQQSILLQESITQPTNCLDFSLEHESQIELIQQALDCIIAEKAKLLNQEKMNCPKCSGKLIKIGLHTSTFNDVFTDHEVNVQRLRCVSCKYEPASTVRTLLNGNTMSGKLSKIQAELGAQHTFRDAEVLLETFSGKSRRINNHNRIKEVTEDVGNAISAVDNDEKALLEITPAQELILNVDGGHVKSREKDTRSFEALTAVVYRPESLQTNKKGTRNYLSNKSCAASTINDQQTSLIEATVIAAIKEGMTAETHITALCDGAQNCWNVVEGLKPLCGDITSILDWFHIGMKMKNISFPEKLKTKFLRVKWHLWRGNVAAAIIRLEQLIVITTSEKALTKLKKFLTYIRNNKDKIVNYLARKKAGLVFTSNLAESTVESLINQRCKGQQHMRWSRKGLNPILQLRAKIHSADWNNKWKTVILNANT
jgi:hypothetical protein